MQCISSAGCWRCCSTLHPSSICSSSAHLPVPLNFTLAYRQQLCSDPVFSNPACDFNFPSSAMQWQRARAHCTAADSMRSNLMPWACRRSMYPVPLSREAGVCTCRRMAWAGRLQREAKSSGASGQLERSSAEAEARCNKPVPIATHPRRRQLAPVLQQRDGRLWQGAGQVWRGGGAPVAQLAPPRAAAQCEASKSTQLLASHPPLPPPSLAFTCTMNTEQAM